jgi:hypothetical protein
MIFYMYLNLIQINFIINLILTKNKIKFRPIFYKTLNSLSGIIKLNIYYFLKT